MTSATVKFAQYFADFQSLSQGPGAGDPAWLKDLRDNAWAKFNETGFPTARRGNERWKYTNVGPIAKADFFFPEKLASSNGSKSLGPNYKTDGAAVYDLVYADGHYSAELSSPANGANGVTADSMASITSENRSGLESQIGRYAPYDNDAFAALNMAFLHDGAYINIPDGRAEPVVVRLSYITAGCAAPKVTHPRTLIVAGKNTDVTVVESYVGPKDSEYFTNAVTEFSLADGARIDHYRLLLKGRKPSTSAPAGSNKKRTAASIRRLSLWALRWPGTTFKSCWTDRAHIAR